MTLAWMIVVLAGVSLGIIIFGQLLDWAMRLPVAYVRRWFRS